MSAFSRFDSDLTLLTVVESFAASFMASPSFPFSLDKLTIVN